jgi:hypothetical protein
MAILAWVATRFMRRLSFPALAIAIVLEILLAVVHSAVPKKETVNDSESIRHEGRRVQLD